MKSKIKKLVIAGASSFAKLARHYFEMDSEYTVTAFVVNKEFIKGNAFEGLPLTAIENIESNYPPAEYSVYVAIGYSKMNKIRERIYKDLKNKGYSFANYISSSSLVEPGQLTGDNCFIGPGNILQPFTKIGNNVVLVSGNNIAHDTIIEDHCFFGCGVKVSGFVRVRINSFIGSNATIADGVTIAPETLIGAGAIIIKDTVEKGVYMPARSVLLEKSSSELEISGK